MKYLKGPTAKCGCPDHLLFELITENLAKIQDWLLQYVQDAMTANDNVESISEVVEEQCCNAAMYN